MKIGPSRMSLHDLVVLFSGWSLYPLNGRVTGSILVKGRYLGCKVDISGPRMGVWVTQIYPRVRINNNDKKPMQNCVL